MTERDVMALLAKANPVRVEGLPPLDVDLGDRIVAGRTRPNRRVALATAIALAALAAALIAIFATGGRQSPPSLDSMEPGIGSMDTAFTPTVRRPLPGSEVTLAEASAAIEQPIVLPDTALISPSDAGAAWVSGTFPNVTAAVTFPSQGVFIDYTAPPPFSDMSADYQEIAQQNPHGFETIELNGETALVVKQNSDDTGHNFGGVIFVLNGAEISVFGHYDEATLQQIAQSIVDRASTEQPVTPPTQLAGPTQPEIHVGSVAEADAQLPFKVVLPSTRPLVMLVARPQQNANGQISAFFNAAVTGPYQVVEQPADALGGIQTVAQLRTWANTCRSRVVCPIHKIVLVRGTHVLLIGAPGRPGGLTVFWLRGDRTGSVLTWIQGPTDYSHGDLSHHRFRPRAALAVAADIIAHGG